MTKVMMKMHMLRLDTKLVPRVSKNEPTSIPPTTAVTTAATMMMRMESSFIAKPMITMAIPRSLSSSMGSMFAPPFAYGSKVPGACRTAREHRFSVRYR